MQVEVLVGLEDGREVTVEAFRLLVTAQVEVRLAAMRLVHRMGAWQFRMEEQEDRPVV